MTDRITEIQAWLEAWENAAELTHEHIDPVPEHVAWLLEELEAYRRAMAKIVELANKAEEILCRD